MQAHLYKVMHVLDLANAVEPMSIMELHWQLGHIAVSSTCKLVSSRAIVGVKLDTNLQETKCNACIYAHATHKPVPKSRTGPAALNFGNKVHADVWGPATITTCQNQRYFITFTDNATCYTTTFLLHIKDKAIKAYKMLKAWAVTQYHCQAIKVLRSNWGGGYLSKKFDQHLAKAGMVRKLTTHNTPQLNGIAECMNQTLLKRIHTLST